MLPSIRLPYSQRQTKYIKTAMASLGSFEQEGDLPHPFPRDDPSFRDDLFKLPGYLPGPDPALEL
jgi:hypothetical protein